ncbi:dTDP-4-dehydrorhamnose 3,5-epimerase-like enzyme [Burkholderia sp. Ch1-1]|nr:dTDP-4-dehydrorhamnose 3,5-epimerase-like enzyme [Burkholderia sp. Ch1-1]
MAIQVTATALPEVKIIEPKVFGDARGFFFESFNAKEFVARIWPGFRFETSNVQNDPELTLNTRSTVNRCLPRRTRPAERQQIRSLKCEMKFFDLSGAAVRLLRACLLCLVAVSTSGFAQYRTASSRQPTPSPYSTGNASELDYTSVDPATLTSYSSTGLPVSDDSDASKLGHYKRRYAGHQRRRDLDDRKNASNSPYTPPDLTKEATVGKDLIDEPDYLTSMMIESASESGDDLALGDNDKKGRQSKFQTSKKRALESSLLSQGASADTSSLTSYSAATSTLDNTEASPNSKRFRLSPAMKSYRSMLSGVGAN